MKMILAIIGIFIFILTGKLAAKSEAKSFNKGMCPRCNTKLRYFVTDSQGGRGYTCDKCQYTTWVSYPGVDKNYFKKEGGN